MKRLPVLVACGLCAVVMGCGGGGSTPPASLGTTPSAGTVAIPTSGSTPAAGGGSSLPGTTFKNKDCTKLAQAYAGALSGGLANTKPQDIVNRLKAFANLAPSQIKGDITAIADAMSTYFANLARDGVDFNNPAASARNPAVAAKAAADVRAFTTAIKTPERHLVAFCGVTH